MRVRIKPGKKYGAFSQYREGDELEVTPAELVAFSDKFTVVDDSLDAAPDPSFETKWDFKSRVEFDASSMTVDEVLRAVQQGNVSVKIAIDSELGGKARKTLLRKLQKMQ